MFVLSRTLQSLLLVLVYFWCLCVGGSVWFVNCIFLGGTTIGAYVNNNETECSFLL